MEKQNWNKDYQTGLSIGQIAKKYGASKSTVWKYLRNRRTISQGVSLARKTLSWQRFSDSLIKYLLTHYDYQTVANLLCVNKNKLMWYNYRKCGIKKRT